MGLTREGKAIRAVKKLLEKMRLEDDFSIIPPIKLFRERTGAGLRDALHAVKDIQAEMRAK